MLLIPKPMPGKPAIDSSSWRILGIDSKRSSLVVIIDSFCYIILM